MEATATVFIRVVESASWQKSTINSPDVTRANPVTEDGDMSFLVAVLSLESVCLEEVRQQDPGFVRMRTSVQTPISCVPGRVRKSSRDDILCFPLLLTHTDAHDKTGVADVSTSVWTIYHINIMVSYCVDATFYL
eukprot:scaffold8495_cov80-Skeletonema_dohrnii-CCMP3373.AAC.2